MSLDDDDVPAIVVTPLAEVIRRRPVDAVAEARFLDELAKTGSRSAAAAAARPHLRSKASALSTFASHIQANPRFAAQVADVEAHVAGLLDREALDRALNGKVTYEKYDPATGKIVERRVDFDNKLLLTVARNIGKRVDPTAWAPDEKKLVVEGMGAGVKAVVDMDKFLDDMPTDALRAMMVAVGNAKVMGLPESVIDVGDEGADEVDPVAEAIQASCEKPLDDGTDRN